MAVAQFGRQARNPMGQQPTNPAAQQPTTPPAQPATSPPAQPVTKPPATPTVVAATKPTTLPATSPTTLQATNPAALPPPSPAVPLGPSRPAEMSYAHGQLQITADNSSLNQILREIGRLTGMKITGGVADERVYGKYGPGGPDEILGDLLEGSGSNMLLLREPSSAAPVELILSPRGGGATPPNPNAAGFDDDAADRQPARPADGQAPLAGRQRPVPPVTHEEAQPEPAPVAEPAAAPAIPADSAPATSAPAAGASSPASPNGVLTPDQIYQQLQQLQKAQPKQ